MSERNKQETFVLEGRAFYKHLIEVDRDQQFTIYSTIRYDAPFGGDIEGAVTNWVVRTDNLSAASLVAYINSKSHMTGDCAMTSEEFMKLYKEA